MPGKPTYTEVIRVRDGLMVANASLVDANRALTEINTELLENLKKSQKLSRELDEKLQAAMNANAMLEREASLLSREKANMEKDSETYMGIIHGLKALNQMLETQVATLQSGPLATENEQLKARIAYLESRHQPEDGLALALSEDPAIINSTGDDDLLLDSDALFSMDD